MAWRYYMQFPSSFAKRGETIRPTIDGCRIKNREDGAWRKRSENVKEEEDCKDDSDDPGPGGGSDHHHHYDPYRTKGTLFGD